MTLPPKENKLFSHITLRKEAARRQSEKLWSSVSTLNDMCWFCNKVQNRSSFININFPIYMYRKLSHKEIALLHLSLKSKLQGRTYHQSTWNLLFLEWKKTSLWKTETTYVFFKCTIFPTALKKQSTLNYLQGRFEMPCFFRIWVLFSFKNMN